MSNILALDTSAAACSVALSVAGEITEYHELAPRDHTRLILPMVDRVLAETGLLLGQLDAIAYGAGPGSFTGLRICAGVVQGLAFGANLPVVRVSSLAASARGYFADPQSNRKALALVCMDARMGEVYFAAYTCNGDDVRLEGQERLLAPSALPPVLSDGDNLALCGLGSGWRFIEQMPALNREDFYLLDTEVLPRAGAIAELGMHGLQRGEVLHAAEVEPAYLREQVAWKKPGDQSGNAAT